MGGNATLSPEFSFSPSCISFFCRRNRSFVTHHAPTKPYCFRDGKERKGREKKLQNHRVPNRKLDRYRGITSNLGRGKLGKPVRGTFPRAFGDSSTGTRVYITFSRCHVIDKYHLDSLSLSFSFALSFSSRLTMTDGKRIA